MASATETIISGFFVLLASAATLFIIEAKPWRKYLPGRSGVSSQFDQLSRINPQEKVRVFGGFALSITASMTWAAGNVLSRYTASAYVGNIGSIIDISLANYVSGTMFVAIVAGVLHILTRQQLRGFFASAEPLREQMPYVAAISKAANTYLFVAAVMFVNAAAAATLENLHVVWTAIIVSVVGRAVLDKKWVLSASLLMAGSALILRFWDQPLGTSVSALGVGFAVLAGISFAIFIVSWNEKIDQAGTLAQRGIRTALFLGITTICLYLISAVMDLTFSVGEIIPFTHISSRHLFLQLVNGVFNIGVTYFLLAEALRLMKPVQQLAAFLLALGISYAVLFTVLIEALLYGERVSLAQWIGTFLFSVGFAIIKENLSRA